MNVKVDDFAAMPLKDHVGDRSALLIRNPVILWNRNIKQTAFIDKARPVVFVDRVDPPEELPNCSGIKNGLKLFKVICVPCRSVCLVMHCAFQRVGRQIFR